MQNRTVSGGLNYAQDHKWLKKTNHTIRVASLSLKFKFPVTIALNFGFFQFKALKIFQFSGQVNSRQKFCLQLFSSQGLESLDPFNFFQVKALKAQANLEKTRSFAACYFTVALKAIMHYTPKGNQLFPSQLWEKVKTTRSTNYNLTFREWWLRSL